MRGKHPKWTEGWDPNPAYEIAERQLEQIDGRLFWVIREGSKSMTPQQRIAELRATNTPWAKVADTLNEEGYPTKKGGRWHATSAMRVAAAEDPLKIAAKELEHLGRAAAAEQLSKDGHRRKDGGRIRPKDVPGRENEPRDPKDEHETALAIISELRHAYGLGFHAIAVHLNDLGYKTEDGGEWAMHHVRTAFLWHVVPHDDQMFKALAKRMLPHTPVEKIIELFHRRESRRWTEEEVLALVK